MPGRLPASCRQSPRPRSPRPAAWRSTSSSAGPTASQRRPTCTPTLGWARTPSSRASAVTVRRRRHHCGMSTSAYRRASRSWAAATARRRARRPCRACVASTPLRQPRRLGRPWWARGSNPNPNPYPNPYPGQSPLPFTLSLSLSLTLSLSPTPTLSLTRWARGSPTGRGSTRST